MKTVQTKREQYLELFTRAGDDFRCALDESHDGRTVDRVALNLLLQLTTGCHNIRAQADSQGPTPEG